MSRVVDQTVEDTVRRFVASGDHGHAAGALIRGYGPRVIGYLRGVLRDEGLASDAFSQFGENVWTGIAGFRGEATALAWAYRLAWSAICRVTSSGYQRRRAPLETTEADRLVAAVRTATRPYQQTEMKDAIARLRERLDPAEQSLLFLRVDQNLPWSEVAGVMEIDDATLRKRFERVKDKLRKLAEQAGLMKGA